MKSRPTQDYDYSLSRRDMVGATNLAHPPSFLVRRVKRMVAGGRSAFQRQTWLPQDTTTAINWLLRLLVGGAFVFAGALKIADPAQFALAVGNYRLVPHELINLVAILVPWVEVLAGLMVLTGIWLRAAALVISSLTVMFAVVIVSALARGLNIECGCFGTVGGKHVGLVNLVIDATLFCLSALLAWRAGHTFSETGAQTSAPPP